MARRKSSRENGFASITLAPMISAEPRLKSAVTERRPPDIAIMGTRTRQLHDHLDTVHFGHQDVGNDQIGPQGFEQLQGFHAVTGNRDEMPVVGQHLDQWFAKSQIIFNDQNTGHVGLLHMGSRVRTTVAAEAIPQGIAV